MEPRLYYNAVIMIENHLRFVTDSYIASKRLVNVYRFRVHVYYIKRQAHPTAQASIHVYIRLLISVIG